MEYAFPVESGGLVRVVMSDELPLMKQAIEDSIGTRPPRGAPQDGPSTYWIDEAIKALRARIEDDSGEPFASGNITYLQVRGGVVEAGYDVDALEDEILYGVPAAEFLDLLAAWRHRVLAESPTADQRIPPPGPARPMPSS